MTVRLTIFVLVLILLAGVLPAWADGRRDGADFPPRCSTFLGGAGRDHPWSQCVVSIPGTECIIVAGYTYSSGFPVTAGALQDHLASPGTRDLFVCCLDLAAEDGDQLVWSTYFGGSSYEWPSGLHVDAEGKVTVAGTTTSSNFPVTANAFDSSPNGGYDAFVFRFSVDVSGLMTLHYSTYFGGSGIEGAEQTDPDVDCPRMGLDVNGMGEIVLGSMTTSSDFPVTDGAFDVTFGGGTDGFVAVLDPGLAPAEQLRYATFLGGDNLERSLDVAWWGDDQVVFLGATMSADFPVTSHAFMDEFQVASGTLTVIAPNGDGLADLRYSSFCGDIYPYDLHVSESGIATIAGAVNAWAPDLVFPITDDAYDRDYNGGARDVGVSRYDLNLPGPDQLLYSTFLGGPGDEQADAVAVDAWGRLHLACESASPALPLTPETAFDHTWAGGAEGYLACLDPAEPPAAQLVHAEFVGGTGGDWATNVVLTGAGYPCVVGLTTSTDFWTSGNAFDRSYNGAYDLFVRDFPWLYLTAIQDPDLAPAGPGFTARPNPFNPRLQLELQLGDAGLVTVTVHDLRGRLVRTLVDTVLPPGPHTFAFDGRDDAGRDLPSGTYVARCTTGTHAQSVKVSLVR